MKKHFTIKLLLLVAFVIFTIGTPQKIQAQTLEEIPNPAGYQLSWFSGGEDGDLFFEYFGPTLHFIPLHMMTNFISQDLI